jgi:hypothetical protein
MPQSSSMALCLLAAMAQSLRTHLSWHDPRRTRALLHPPSKRPVRTDLTPRDKNDCLAVAQTLNVQVKRLAQQTKRAIPLEFTRVASDLNQSCGAEDFNKAMDQHRVDEWMHR